MSSNSPFFGNREPCTLVSPFSRAECVRRLRDSVAGTWQPFSGSMVSGKIRDASFEIKKRGRSYFPTILLGAISDQGETTQLTCRFSVSWVTPILFMLLMLAFGTSPVLMMARDGYFHPALLRIPLVTVGFGAAVLVVARLLARNDGAFLVQFLRVILEAQEVQASNPVGTATISRRS